MKRIVRHHLRLNDVTGIDTLYGDVLGMTRHTTPKGQVFGFDPNQCSLEFSETASRPYDPQLNDFYWKTGITLRNLDAAVQHLRDKGLPIADPRQFRDIGYMTHMTDPAGFAIELLQQGFQGDAAPAPTGHPIASQATLAHITLRVTDIALAQRYFEQTLGMRLMSVQPVPERSFTLYFYAWDTSPLPDPDLRAVVNRAWLWSRPYALIELQHLTAADANIGSSPRENADFDGFSISEGGNGEHKHISRSDLAHLS